VSASEIREPAAASTPSLVVLDLFKGLLIRPGCVVLSRKHGRIGDRLDVKRFNSLSTSSEYAHGYSFPVLSLSRLEGDICRRYVLGHNVSGINRDRHRRDATGVVFPAGSPERHASSTARTRSKALARGSTDPV
jgi:hypothetical protein